MNTIYKVATGEYLATISPLTLTLIESDAMQFEDNEAGGYAESLSQSENVAYAVGRPGDRQKH